MCFFPSFQFALAAQEVSVLDKLTGSFSYVADFEINTEKKRFYLLNSASDSIWLNDQKIIIEPNNDPFSGGSAYLLSAQSDGTLNFIRNFGYSRGNIVLSDSSVFLFLTFAKDTLFTTDTFFVKTGTNPSSNMVAFEYNLDGDLLRAKHWHSPFKCGFYINHADFSDNYFYVTGVYANDTMLLDDKKIATIYGGTDIFLGQIDSSFSCRWLKRLGGNDQVESVLGMTANNNGDVITTGYSASNWFYCGQDSVENEWAGSNTSNMFISKLDVDGNCEWLRQVKDPYSEVGTGIGFLTDGSVVVSGNYYGWNADFGDTILANPAIAENAFMARYAPNGELSWASQTGGDTSQSFTSLAVSPNDEIWVCGKHYSSQLTIGTFTLPQRGEGDAFVAKYDKLGHPLYATSFGGEQHDYSYQIETGGDNSIFVELQSISDSVEIGDTYYYLKENSSNVFIIEIKDTLATAAEIKPISEHFNLFPNPVKSGEVINFDIAELGKPGFYQISLYSMYGQLIAQYKVSNVQNNIRLPFIPSGVYLLQTNDEIEKRNQVFKIVVN